MRKTIVTLMGAGLVAAGITAGMGSASANPLCPGAADPMAGCSVSPPTVNGRYDQNGTWHPMQPGVTNPSGTIDSSGQLPNGGMG